MPVRENLILIAYGPWADPEGVGGTGGPDLPWKITNAIGSLGIKIRTPP